MANGRCRMHGGTAVAGPGHPAFSHGRYSKAKINPALLRRLEAAAGDPDLMTVVRDVEALEARLLEILEAVETIPTAEYLQRVRELCRAIRAGDTPRVAELTRLVEAESSPAARTAAAWREYERIAERKRRLIESHQRTQIEAGQVVALSHFAHAIERFVWLVIEAADLDTARLEARRMYISLMGLYDAEAAPLDVEARPTGSRE